MIQWEQQIILFKKRVECVCIDEKCCQITSIQFNRQNFHHGKAKIAVLMVRWFNTSILLLVVNHIQLVNNK